MASEDDKVRSRQDGKDILAVCRDFLQALLDKEDWRPFGQRHYVGTKLEPNIPQYLRFKVLKTRKLPETNNPERHLVTKDVDIRLELVPSGHVGMRWADYRLRVVKERGPYQTSADDVMCSECEGTGLLADDTTCPYCEGLGMCKSTWGVVPTSCRFVAWRNEG